MTLQIQDRVKETTTTTGTGALTLAGAVTGYRAFSAVCTSPSDTCYYALQAVDANGVPTGEWEVGLGTYSAANTLTRTSVLASSNAGAAVNLAAGTKQVWIDLAAANLAAPQVAVYTSGSGTYTTPANAKFLTVELVGGGGGGAGSGSGATSGAAGGNTTFGTSLLTGGGGLGGSASTPGGMAGGVATGGDINLAGGNSLGANGALNCNGGEGGCSFFGGVGPPGNIGQAGVNAAVDSGSGAGGAGSSSTSNAGGGGSAGAYCRKLIASPLATYPYAVGAGGAHGGLGTGGAIGGDGGNGLIIVTAFF